MHAPCALFAPLSLSLSLSRFLDLSRCLAAPLSLSSPSSAVGRGDRAILWAAGAHRLVRIYGLLLRLYEHQRSMCSGNSAGHGQPRGSLGSGGHTCTGDCMGCGDPMGSGDPEFRSRKAKWHGKSSGGVQPSWTASNDPWSGQTSSPLWGHDLPEQAAATPAPAVGTISAHNGHRPPGGGRDWRAQESTTFQRPCNDGAQRRSAMGNCPHGGTWVQTINPLATQRAPSAPAATCVLATARAVAIPWAPGILRAVATPWVPAHPSAAATPCASANQVAPATLPPNDANHDPPTSISTRPMCAIQVCRTPSAAPCPCLRASAVPCRFLPPSWWVFFAFCVA